MFMRTDTIRKCIISQYTNVFDYEAPSIYIDAMDTLRRNIINKMGELGLNPYTLAEKSGVPQPTIQRFLKNKIVDPRSSTIQKLARGLNTTESDLRGFNNEQESKIKEINKLMSKLSIEQVTSLELIIKSMVNALNNTPKPENKPLTNPAENVGGGQNPCQIKML